MSERTDQTAVPPERVFTHAFRVPYAHVDQMGVVYYANYLVYFEMARSAMLREAGLPYPEMEQRGVLLPVVEAHCEYARPARFDDLIAVQTRCTAIEGPRLRMEYVVRRGDETLATGHTVHVCMSPQGRILRPTPELRKLFGAGGSGAT